MSKKQILEETLRFLEVDDRYLNNNLQDSINASSRINYLGTSGGGPRHLRKTTPPPDKNSLSSSFGAANPNPNKWLPTSHFPKKKPLTAEKKKGDRPKNDPFIDRFIEEIANSFSNDGGGVGDNSRSEEKKDGSSTEETPEEFKERLYR